MRYPSACPSHANLGQSEEKAPKHLPQVLLQRTNVCWRGGKDRVCGRETEEKATPRGSDTVRKVALETGWRWRGVYEDAIVGTWPGLLPRAMSEAMVLLQLGSKDPADVCGLGWHWRPCGYLKAVTLSGDILIWVACTATWGCFWEPCRVCGPMVAGVSVDVLSCCYHQRLCSCSWSGLLPEALCWAGLAPPPCPP